MPDAASPRSMAAFWLVGFEDQPERSGEICVTEVFGKDIDPGGRPKWEWASPFRDPELTEDFAAPDCRSTSPSSTNTP